VTPLSLFSPRDLAITDPGEVPDHGAGAEFFPTAEREIVASLLRGMAVAGHEPLPLHGAVRESAAGEGALVEHINALVPSESRVWILHELRGKAVNVLRKKRSEHVLGNVLAIRQGDFFAAAEDHDDTDLDISNGPWSRIIEHAEASLKTARVVALHAPLATIETPARVAWLRAHMPDVYPLEWRPDYDGRGGMGRPVAWFVWGPGRGGRWFPLTRSEAA
jgi:hypothetical protein